MINELTHNYICRFVEVPNCSLKQFNNLKSQFVISNLSGLIKIAKCDLKEDN